MPKKIRQPKAMLKKAGWLQMPGGEGSHTKWEHAKVSRCLTLSGGDGDDAKPYQTRDVANAVREAKPDTGGNK